MPNLSKRRFLKSSLATVSALALGSVPARAQSEAPRQALIRNARVFDGRGDAVSGPVNILIDGEMITEISPTAEAGEGATVIDAGDRVVTPGLIDAHVHMQWNQAPFAFMSARRDYLAAMALTEAEATLMRGFTSVRDTGGDIFGVARAIDEGHFPGPRIQGAGAGIGMTAGHGDYRNRTVAPRAFGGPDEFELEHRGISRIADGVSEVLAASREQFRNGASFLKLFAGGAVTGLYDPIDVNEYSLAELTAGGEEAKRWNTYMAVHAYTDRSVQTSLEAGAMSIEHANLLSRETLELLVEKGAWLSAQTGVYLVDLPAGFSDAQRARQAQAREGLVSLMETAKEVGAKIAFGCDLVGSPAVKRAQSQELTARKQWFSDVEVLRQATSANGELLAMAGPRSPYQAGPVGVLEPGAYADLLVVEGDPLADVSILSEPEQNLRVIMKGGKAYKNTLG